MGNEILPSTSGRSGKALNQVGNLLSANISSLCWIASAGWAVAFLIWAQAHAELLAPLILTNELVAPARADLLWRLVAGVVIALFLWGLLKAVDHFSDHGRRRLSEWAVVLATLSVLLAFVPALALPGLPSDHPFLTFALVVAMAAITFAGAHRATGLLNHRYPFPLTVKGGLLVTTVLASGYAFLMSLLTVARHNAFMTHAFDLGVYDQQIYTILQDGYVRCTLIGSTAMNAMGDHFSPILYMMAAAFAVSHDVRTLLILQSLMLAAGAIPVYLIARRHIRHIGLAVAFAASYLLFPALHGVNTFDFHQIAPATPLLLWALYFLEIERDAPFLVCLVLALITKEEVALTVAAFGAYVFLVRRRYVLGAALATCGLAYFVIIVGYVIPILGGDAHPERFAGLMAAGSSGLPAVLQSVLTSPAYAVAWVFGSFPKLRFLGQLLVPLMFLPLLGGLPWILAVPALSIPLLASMESTFTLGTQYPATIIPFLFYLAILGAQRLAERKLSATALASALIVASLAMNYEYGWLFGRQFTGIPQPTMHQQVLESFLAQIPSTASISTISDVVPHLSGREDIYLFPVVNDANYILFDAGAGANYWPFTSRDPKFEAASALAPHLTSGEFGLARSEDGIVLLKRGAAVAQNAQVLGTIFSSRVEAENQPSNYTLSATADGRASGGAARVVDTSLPDASNKNALTYGPYLSLLAGRYRVTFVLKVADTRGSQPVATIDVFSTARGGPIAARDIAPSDFQAPDRYQSFSLDVDVPAPFEDVEYRVMYRGPGRLWADYETVVPLRVTIGGTEFEVARPDEPSG